MSEPETINTDDVDALLAEVEQIANDVNDVVDENKEEPQEEKPEPASEVKEEAGQDDVDALLAEVEQIATDVGSASGDKKEEVHEEQNEELSVDKHTERIADDEINDILANVGKRTVESVTEETLQAIKIPGYVKAVVITLSAIDRLFLWIPKIIKDVLGVIAIATLILSMILLMIVCVS